jgi:hypothetical protein
MIRQRHLVRGTIALAAALTAVLAPAAWAGPAPLAKAEAAITANGQSSPAVRPNPDEQTLTGANPGPCSEVCSGGAGSYGPASQRSSTPDEPGATLPHDSRLRAVAVNSRSSTASTPPAVVRVVTHNRGFHWGDAGIGAGGILAITLIGLGGAITLTHRRRVHDAHAS